MFRVPKWICNSYTSDPLRNRYFKKYLRSKNLSKSNPNPNPNP